MNRSPHHNVHAFRTFLEESCNHVREMMEKGGGVVAASAPADAKPKSKL